MVDPNTAMDFKKLQNIIDIDRKGAEIGKSILEDISVNGYTNLDLKDDIMALQLVEPENLPSLMYYYRMLTWGKDADDDAALVIPNRNAAEIIRCYSQGPGICPRHSNPPHNNGFQRHEIRET